MSGKHVAPPPPDPFDFLDRDDGRRSDRGYCYGVEDGLDGYAVHVAGVSLGRSRLVGAELRLLPPGRQPLGLMDPAAGRDAPGAVMKNIPPLYHWSPTFNRPSIMREGLRPTCPTHDGTLAVCLGTDPATALALLPPYDGPLDLYQVHVADTKVFRKVHWGRVAEYRVPRTISPRGIRWLGTRKGEVRWH